MDRHPPRVGCVKYLNARPLIHGWPGQVTFGHPSALCAQLARGELDVALVSSFEFLRNPIYRIVDGVSISSDGPVYSVIVAHHGNISEIEEIELDPASETSVNLLRCLLAEAKLTPRLVARRPLRRMDRHSVRVLTLEGDRTLTARVCSLAIKPSGFGRNTGPNSNSGTLAKNGRNLGDLPFVYALWLVRPEVAESTKVAEPVCGRSAGKIWPGSTSSLPRRTQFDHDFCARYYRENCASTLEKRKKKPCENFKGSARSTSSCPKATSSLTSSSQA